MAPCNSLPDGKLVFLAIYTAVVAGIVFSALVILSSLAVDGGSGRTFYYFDITRTLKRQTEPSNMFTRAIWDVPLDTKMPDLKLFQLTKDMVKHRAQDNIIIVTLGNHAFMDFIVNWVKHLTDLNINNLLVGAMDTKLLESLYWKGIPVFEMGSTMEMNDVGWGSLAFHKMAREKVLLINVLLHFGYEILMCDTDMVWLKNPLPYIARFPEADILTSTDQIRPTITDDSLEVWQKVTGAYNVGLFHWRPTVPAKKLAKDWKDMVLNDPKIWDQIGFNDLLKQILGPSIKGANGLVYAFDGSLKLGILPGSIFCNGHTYFVQAVHHQLNLEPYAVHTTFQYAGTEGKRHRLREAMLFYDQPAYYDSAGGFLSFNPGIPRNLLFDGPHTLHSHFSLMNYQMKLIRTALAVASLLKRTLPGYHSPVFIIEWFDRIWFGHPGIVAGTLTRQPFLCPMDHLFQVNVMRSNLSEAEFGPQIDFREYSFLQNSLVPKHVKESVLDVQLCDAHTRGCNISEKSTSQGFIRFPRNSTEQMYLQTFSQYKDIKILRFSSMVDSFQGFSNAAREAKFRKRVKRYVGLWCCLQNHDPGHIYYDMYWDEKPQWKPEPPRTRKEDHPPWQTD